MADKCKGHSHHLCKLLEDKMHQKDPKAYAKLVENPQWVCKNCGRVAVKSDNLCSAARLGTFED